MTEFGAWEPTFVTMFVMEKLVTTFGEEPVATTLARASMAPSPTIQSSSSAEASAVMLPGNASSVRIVEPPPFAAVKSVALFGAEKVIVRLLAIHTRPSKTAMAVPIKVVLIVVNVVPSQEKYPKVGSTMRTGELRKIAMWASVVTVPEIGRA